MDMLMAPVGMPVVMGVPMFMRVLVRVFVHPLVFYPRISLMHVRLSREGCQRCKLDRNR